MDSPGAESEIVAPVETVETPESTPEAPDQTPDSAESEQEREAKAIKALQRRIDKRTRDLYQERAQREQLERELSQYRQQTAQEAPSLDVDAIVSQRAQELVEQQSLQSKVQSVLNAGKSLEGFDSAVNAAVEELGLLDSRGRPTAALRVVLEADAPAEVLHYIGTNPDVAEKLSGLSPERLAYQIARLEGQIKASKAPKVSAAPKPLAPVKSAAISEELSSSLPVDEWMRRREKQLRERNS